MSRPLETAILPGFDLTAEDIIVGVYGISVEFAQEHYPGMIEELRRVCASNQDHAAE